MGVADSRCGNYHHSRRRAAASRHHLPDHTSDKQKNPPFEEVRNKKTQTLTPGCGSVQNRSIQQINRNNVYSGRENLSRFCQRQNIHNGVTSTAQLFAALKSPPLLRIFTSCFIDATHALVPLRRMTSGYAGVAPPTQPSITAESGQRAAPVLDQSDRRTHRGLRL